MHHCRRLLACFVLYVAVVLPAFAIGTAFTYQGTLEDGGGLADGSYDLQFQLLDAVDAAVGAPLLLQNVAVVRGVFTVQLDFGSAPFDGEALQLRIGVRPGPSNGPFTTLDPPSPLHPAPYAQLADVAQIAASVAANSVDSGKVVDGSLGAVDIRQNEIQWRVDGECLAGSSIRAVAADGSVICQPGSGAFTLPFAITQAHANPLFGVTNSGAGAALSGNSSGAGSNGVGVLASSTTGTGLVATSSSGIPARVSITNAGNANTALQVTTAGGGNAARFETQNASSSENTLQVQSNGAGNPSDVTLGNVASFVNTNPDSVAAAVRAEVTTTLANVGAAAIAGTASGTGGTAGLFRATNPLGSGAAVQAISQGLGAAVLAHSNGQGVAVNAYALGAGDAVRGVVPVAGTGRAARFDIQNPDNDNSVVTVRSVGNGDAVDVMLDNTTGTSAALRGEVNTIFANFGAAGVYGVSSGTGGVAGLFHATNAQSPRPALVAMTDGTGEGIMASANDGNGIETTADGAGSAIFAWTPNFGTGRAARFVNYSTTNTQPVLTAEQHSNGSIAVFRSGNPSSVNVARINSAGRGFFNGGTQTSGADLAEVVPLSGVLPEPGDVVEIDPERASHFRLASTAHSTLVAGVISTEPGVLLNAPNADESLPEPGPALALAGRVPVKVTNANGAIAPGDLLVASTVPGHAMRATPNPVIGSVIGKALEAFDADEGVIEMLVMLR